MNITFVLPNEATLLDCAKLVNKFKSDSGEYNGIYITLNYLNSKKYFKALNKIENNKIETKEDIIEDIRILNEELETISEKLDEIETLPRRWVCVLWTLQERLYLLQNNKTDLEIELKTCKDVIEKKRKKLDILENK